jgi:hypothetical protein
MSVGNPRSGGFSLEHRFTLCEGCNVWRCGTQGAAVAAQRLKPPLLAVTPRSTSLLMAITASLPGGLALGRFWQSILADSEHFACAFANSVQQSCVADLDVRAIEIELFDLGGF